MALPVLVVAATAMGGLDPAISTEEELVEEEEEVLTLIDNGFFVSWESLLSAVGKELGYPASIRALLVDAIERGGVGGACDDARPSGNSPPYVPRTDSPPPH